MKTYDLHDDFQRKMYTDQTGQFPIKSSRGNQYIMVLVELDSKAIIVEGMRHRTLGEMIRAYQKLVDRMKKCGVASKHHALDNEYSREFKEAIKENQMTYQLADAHDHRCNIAEKAIQTFKDHFVPVLCGADDNFPMHLWDQLLE